MCCFSDSEIPTSESLETVILKSVQDIDPLPDRSKQEEKKPCSVVHLEVKNEQYNKKVYNRTCFVLLGGVLEFNISTAVLLLINLTLDIKVKACFQIFSGWMHYILEYFLNNNSAVVD